MDRTHLALFDVSINSLSKITTQWLNRKRDALLRDIDERVSRGLPRKYGDVLVSCVHDAYGELARVVHVSSSKRWLTDTDYITQVHDDDTNDAPFARNTDAPFEENIDAPFARVPSNVKSAYERVSVQTQNNGEVVRVSRETRRNKGGHNTSQIKGTRETADGSVVRLTPQEAKQYLVITKNKSYYE